MFTYSLDTGTRTALYDQVYRHIKRDILSGRLHAFERLPSKRALSQHLKISVVTVENAYAQLIAEGYVYSEEKRGYFVSPIEQSGLQPAPAAPVIEAPPEKRFILDIRANRMDPKNFPFSVWSKITRSVLSRQDVRILEPVPYNGVLELRQAIADYLFRFRGIGIHPEQVVVGAGTEYLYGLLVQLLGREHTFAVENPGYLKIQHIYAANGVSYRCIDLDEDGVSMDGLRKSGAAIVHLSPSHHFPTGIITSIGRRWELLNWAKEDPNRYIIEDDYDSEFRFTGRPIPTMQSIDPAERVVYINSFSKTIAPSIRISYLILPPHLAERFYRDFGFYACTVSSFEQYTLAEFIREGHFESHISRMKKFYREQRNRVISAIEQSPLADRATIYEKDAGLHFLLRLDTDKSDWTIFEAAEAAGIRLAFMTDYLSKPSAQYDHMLVVNYSGIDIDAFTGALKILADTL